MRRDGAYTIFYMGINLGSFIGVLIAGYLGETYGWSYGFGAAGVGMLLGLLVFVWGKPLLMGRAEPPSPELLAKPVGGIKLEWLLYGAGLAAIAVLWVLVQLQELVGWMLLVSGGLLLAYIAWVAVTKLAREERDQILVIIFLLLLQPVFWGLFEQAGASVNLFTDRHVDRMFLGWEIPTTWFQSVNAAFIILLGPVFAWMWTALGRRGLEPSTPAKFGLAIVQVGLGFLLLVWGTQAQGVDLPTSLWLVVLLYLLHTTGELCLSPVGLSAMNRLAPWHMAGLIMGAWFFATAGGNFVAGQISAMTGAENAESGEGAKDLFLEVWSTVGWVAIAIGVVVLVLRSAREETDAPRQAQGPRSRRRARTGRARGAASRGPASGDQSVRLTWLQGLGGDRARPGGAGALDRPRRLRHHRRQGREGRCRALSLDVQAVSGGADRARRRDRLRRCRRADR